MNIRLLYLYLFSFVGLLIVVIGSIQMVNLGLKLTVFKNVDKYEIYDSPKDQMSDFDVEQRAEGQKRDIERQRQREFMSAFSMLLVGTPLYIYHWKMIKKEGNKV